MKRPEYKETRGNGKTKVTTSKSLPYGKNSSPTGTPTGGPRATPRQGPRPLEDRHWPWPGNLRMTDTGTGAPANVLASLGGRGATAGQWPRRLEPGVATRLGHGRRARGDLTGRGRRRGVGARAVGSAWSLLRSFRPGSVDIAPRWTLEDPVKTRRHPLGIVAVLVVIIVFAGGFFLRLPPLPRFSSTCI